MTAETGNMRPRSTHIDTPPPALGSYVRLHQLSPVQLPIHPALSAYQTDQTQTPPTLDTFVTTILTEAETFAKKYLPAVIKVRSAKKTVPPARATVQLAEHSIPAADLPATARTPGGESWFIRSSLHENEPKTGTADWAEFEGALLDDHSEHERDYTPDVFDAHRVLDWNQELGQVQHRVGGWEKVEMGVFEMAHKMPPPLANRVFSVLVVKAKKTNWTPHSFLIAQIPLEIAKAEGALYANGRHKKDGDTAQKKKDITMGVYVSVERCELESSGHVKWFMATASDAKGNLPLWLQKTAIPGAVAKDVGLVIDWLQKKRTGGE